MNAPQNLEAERGLIAALIAEPYNIPVIASTVDDDDFYLDSHRIIYRKLVMMRNEGAAIDSITLYDRLKGFCEFSFLAEMQEDGVPSHAGQYAQIVKEQSQRRTVWSGAQEIIKHIDDGADSIAILTRLDKLTATLFKKQKASTVTIREVAERLIAEVELAQEGGDREQKLLTGFASIDNATGSIKRKKLIIFGGRTSMGKSALAMNVAHNIAKQGHAVLVISIESPCEEIMARLVSSFANIENRKLQSLHLNDFETTRTIEAAKELAKLDITLIDNERRWDRLTQEIRAAKIKNPALALVVIDYLQLIQVAREKDRYREIAQITGDCKSLAKELDVLFILLSQLNRRVEERQDKHPTMSDLRESGDIEQDADVVALLYREKYYDDDADDVTDIDIAKDRDGKRGIVKLTFDDKHVRFRDS